MIRTKPKAKTQAGPVNQGRLKSFIERAEKIIEERKAVSGDLTDIFSEAKGAGYDVKTMRAVIRERAMDAADRAEQETLLDVYRHALGMAVELVSNGDVSLRDAAKATGVSKSSIHRALAVPEVSQREMEDGDLGEWCPSVTMPAERGLPVHTFVEAKPAGHAEPTTTEATGEGEQQVSHETAGPPRNGRSDNVIAHDPKPLPATPSSSGLCEAIPESDDNPIPQFLLRVNA